MQAKKAMLERSLKELKEKLKKQREELYFFQMNDMDQSVKDWVIDFMNLIFGASEDHDNYWEDIVIPETESYYNFDAKILKAHEVNLNALYFAILVNIGLTLIPVQEKQSEQKD